MLEVNMEKILEELKENQKSCSLYINVQDTSKFVFGKILELNGMHIMFFSISPDGEYDGVLLIKIDNILRVEYNDLYSARMSKLIKDKNFSCKFDFISIENNNLVELMLNSLLKEKIIVSIELLDSSMYDVIGFVEEINENICKIRQVNDDGQDDGITYIRMDDITQISADSSDERRILRLLDF